MLELNRRIVRAVVIALVALVGLTMAIIFTASTLIAITVAVAVAKMRGKPFAPKEYWMARQSRRKALFTQGSLKRTDVTDVTDVQARDVP